eukprot:4556308-Alexandrium_andersonii.AAC.1
MCNLALPQVRQPLPAHAEPHCPDDGHGGPRKSASSNDGFAITVAGVVAMVPVAVVATAGLCVCSERFAHV